MQNLRPSSYFILLSCTLVLVDLTFSAFYIVISGNAASVPETLALSVFFLLIVNVSVGLWLFRHIRKQEAGLVISEARLSRHEKVRGQSTSTGSEYVEYGVRPYVLQVLGRSEYGVRPYVLQVLGM